MKMQKIMPVISAILIMPMMTVISGAPIGDVLTAAAELTRAAAYISAGIPYKPAADENNNAHNDAVFQIDAEEPPFVGEDLSYEETIQPGTAESQPTEESVDPPSDKTASVIPQNISAFDDGVDRTSEGIRSGVIIRRHYGTGDTGEYITLKSGAQVRNLTSDSADILLSAAQELPDIEIEPDTDEPQVLIVHTHTTESYEPYQRDYYDDSFPSRSRDPRYNMIAVGEMLAGSLAENGISVVHDGTVHDHPSYTGSYDRSEETIRAILEEYPSIKVVIDLHRDAMADADGSRIAPIVDINGRNAAQFMIIAGCDDGRFNMPDYIENFKLAALIQNSSELMYPGLARAVLFDYRNYNQHITTGSLLIEIGSHANSLDEALYTAEMLGDSMAAALKMLT